MRSRVADETRRDQTAHEAELTVGERLQLLEKANELAIELYAKTHGLLRNEALGHLGQAIKMNEPRSPVPLLHKLTSILEREQIEYAMIGAFAMIARNASRTTFDVDFLTTDRKVLALDWRLAIGDQVSVEVRRGDHEDPLAGVVRFAPKGQISCEIVVGRWDWQSEIVKRAERLEVQGALVPVARAADLCLLKIDAGGPQDLRDVTLLLERNPEAVAELKSVAPTLPQRLRADCEAFLASR